MRSTASVITMLLVLGREKEREREIHTFSVDIFLFRASFNVIQVKEERQ